MPEFDAHCAQFICQRVWNSYISFSSTYVAFVLFGMASIILFSSRMISQPTYLSDEKKDPIGLFAPKYLTFRAKYRLASISYCLLLLVAYLVLTLVLDQPGVDLPTWGKLKPAPTAPIKIVKENVTFEVKNLDATVPLLLAFMLIGFLPRIQLVELYEKRLREWVHEIFLIPALGRSTANRIETAAIRPDMSSETCLTSEEGAYAEEMLGFKFMETLERMTFVLRAPERIGNDRSIGDADHIALYHERFETAATLMDKFCRDVSAAIYMIYTLSEPEKGVTLLSERLKSDHRVLHDEVRFLALVIAGAILRRTRNETQINRALDRIGLREPMPILPTTAGDLAIFVALLAAIAYWLWLVVQVALTAALTKVPGAFEYVSDQMIAITIDSVVSFFFYAFVLYLALSYQARRKEQLVWAAHGDKGFARRIEYLKIAILCTVVAAVAIFLYQALLFGFLFVPEKGPNWAHIGLLSLVLAIRLAVIAVLIVLLVDRQEADSNNKGSLALLLALFIFLVFLAGYTVGYTGVYIRNASLVKGTDASPAPMSDPQWREALLTGLQGIWIVSIVVPSLLKEIRDAVSEAATKLFHRFTPT
jgi:hypothetical protein